MDKLPIAAGGLYSRQMAATPTARVPCGPGIARRSGALSFLAGALISAATWVSAQTGSFDLVATIAAPASIVHADGSVAVLANGNTLTLLDISVPDAPDRRGTLTLTDQVWDLVVDGDRAYVANGFVGLVVVDLSDSDTPVVLGTYEVVSQGQTVSVAMAGDLVLTTNNQTGLNAFDVADPTAPKLLSSWLTGGYSRDVAGMNHLGLVADQPDGLHVIDLSDPLAPLEASIHFADGETTQLIARSASTSTAFIVDSTTAQVEIVDVSDPARVSRTGVYQAPGRVSNLTARGTTLFLTLGRLGLAVVDVSDPSAPTLKATFDTPGTAQSVALTDDVTLVADGEAVLVLRAH